MLIARVHSINQARPFGKVEIEPGFYYCDGCCEANCIHVGNCHCVEAKKNAETACDTFECRQ